MSIMDFLGRLLGVRPAPAAASANKATAGKASGRARSTRDARYESEILSVDSLRFVGQSARSENKRWVVGWTDRLPSMNPRRGCSDGSIVLIDYPADRVVARITDLYRPMEGDVADNGTFLFNDANFGDRLSGDVHAYDVSGKRLFNRTFAANVLNLAISKCGRYGVVQTANARGDDGNLLELYDLRAGTTLFSREPETGWSDRYAFSVNDTGELTRLTVVHNDLGRFGYAPTGEFLEKGAYRKARLDNGSAESRVYGAKDALKADPANRAVAEEVLATLDAALGELHEQRSDFLALGLRVKGEALEVLDRKAQAMVAYEQALAIDPKIGVAKRLATLRKGAS